MKVGKSKSLIIVFILFSIGVSAQSPDGLIWSSVDSGTEVDFRSIQGGVDNTAFAGGGETTLLYFDGAAWSEAPGWNTTDSPFLEEDRWDNVTLGNVGVSRHGGVFVGNSGDSRMAVLDPDTGIWTQYNPWSWGGPRNASQMAVIDNPDETADLVQFRTDAHTIATWENAPAGAETNNVGRMDQVFGTVVSPSAGVSATSLSNIWFAGQSGGTGRIAHGVGANGENVAGNDDWTILSLAEETTMNPVHRSLHAVSESLVVFGGQGPGSSGANGAVLIWEDTNPEEVSEIGYFSGNPIFAVYGENSSAIWAGGENFLAFYDGDAWSDIPVQGVGTIRSLARSADGTLWAAGDSGQIYMAIPEPGTLILLGLAGLLLLKRRRL